ncbi:MAG: hypothetical protein NCW75_11785 [Phycisphaera sp.]|nr:MAG: hypothetical protein NCW75_11785 [Phycisphaera sp.]
MATQYDYEPIDGVCFWCEPMPAARLSALLKDVVAFLHNVDPHAELTRFHDWLQHDGLHFFVGSVVFARLFSDVSSPRDLLVATPEDDLVYCGVEDRSRRWYLRFRVEWDDAGFELSGDFALVLVDALAEGFATRFADRGLYREPAAEYFRRITV